MGCGVPDCGHDHSVLYLHAQCHITGGTRASYDKNTGILTIACIKCTKPVATIAVAERKP